MSGNYQEMVLGEKGGGWVSGTETAQKGHLIPEAGRKEGSFSSGLGRWEAMEDHI